MWGTKRVVEFPPLVRPWARQTTNNELWRWAQERLTHEVGDAEVWETTYYDEKTGLWYSAEEELPQGSHGCLDDLKQEIEYGLAALGYLTLEEDALKGLRGVPGKWHLMAAGYRTKESVAAAPDGQLLCVRGIGPALLRRIRDRLPGAPDGAGWVWMGHNGTAARSTDGRSEPIVVGRSRPEEPPDAPRTAFRLPTLPQKRVAVLQVLHDIWNKLMVLEYEPPNGPHAAEMVGGERRRLLNELLLTIWQLRHFEEGTGDG